MPGRALPVGPARSLVGELLLRGREEVLELLVAASRAHPGPAESLAKLGGAMALARAGAAADADRRLVGLGDRRGLRLRAAGLAGGKVGALGPDLGRGGSDGAAVADVLRERGFEEGAESAKL